MKYRVVVVFLLLATFGAGQLAAATVSRAYVEGEYLKEFDERANREAVEKTEGEEAERHVREEAERHAKEESERQAKEIERQAAEVSEKAKAVEAQAKEEAEREASEAATVRCVVPALKGKTIGAVHNALDRSHCGLGRIGRPKRSHGVLVVVKQSLPSGTRAARGTAVAVRLGPRKTRQRHDSHR
jgi:archaellum component FlaD/FlaE